SRMLQFDLLSPLLKSGSIKYIRRQSLIVEIELRLFPKELHPLPQFRLPVFEFRLQFGVLFKELTRCLEVPFNQCMLNEEFTTLYRIDMSVPTFPSGDNHQSE